MRAIICLGLLGLYVAANPAAAQGNGHLPNAAPLKTMERAHAYHLTNMSSHLIVAAHIKMSDGSERDLTWDKPVQPRQGREIAVPANECMALLTVKFRSGKTMQSGAPNCNETRIIVTDDAIQIGSSASDRPPVQ
ncbi:MAG TPA: hypothetical protein VFL55_03115 [Acetobacteraceae bacterium]|nr:hypothetical protein [Acetobacteraceae bacterium]